MNILNISDFILIIEVHSTVFPVGIQLPPEKYN